MAEFYPSEVARLVLGYLDEVKCSRSRKTFLEESSDLQEHNRLLKAGKSCTTNVNGKSLLEILAEYCVLKEAANSAHISRLSTPSKVNGNAYARFEINQKIQTRSFISKQTNHVPPPVSPFRSPAARPTPHPTPRRRLECQSTQLNFYKETDSVNNNAPNTSSAENVLTCNSSPVHAARRIIYNSPIISRHSTCYPDSSIPSASLKVNDKNSEKVLLLTNKSPLLMTLNSSQLKLLSPSKLAKTPDKTSNEVKNSSGSRTEHNESKTPIHSTPNENVRFSIGSTVQTSELNIGSVAGKNNAQSEEAVISVNQSSSVVCVSSEITTSATESHEGNSTPHYDVNPPPYTRAPLTDSPRIVLSHDRSLIASLTTPMKDKRSWAEEEWSPKRKGSLPRRRLVSESPQSKYVQQPDAGLSFDTMMENLFQIGPEDELFNEDAPFVQLLTDNINKAKQSDMQEECHGQNGSLDDIIKNATELTEEKIEDLFLLITQNKESNFSSVSKSDDAKCLSNTSEPVSLTKTTENIICDKNFTTVEVFPENFMDSNQSDINLNSDINSANKVSGPSEAILKDVQTVIIDNHSASVQSSIDVQQMHSSVCNDSQANNLDSNDLSRKQADSSNVNTTELTKTLNNLNDSIIANSKDFQSADSTTNAAIKNTSIVDSVSENPCIIESCSEIDGGAAASDVNAEHNVDSITTYNSQISENTPITNVQNIPLNDTAHGEQPEMTVVQADLANPPNTILEVPLATIPTFILPTYTPGGLVQNSMYRIIVNTPIGDMCLPLPSIPTANLPNSVVLNSTPAVQSVSENLDTVSGSIPVANEVTISSSNRASKRGKPACPGNTKKRKTSEQNSEPKRKKTSGNQRKKTKRKLISLFSDSPPEVKVNVTPIKNSNDNIPVLSIPESPSNSEQSSALKLFSQITGQCEKVDKSPVLKSLMSEAAVLLNKGARLNFSHVRCLDFTSASVNNNEDESNNIRDRSSEVNDENEPSGPKRRSTRIQNKKMSGNLKTYERNSLRNCQKTIRSAANDVPLSAGSGNSAKTSSTDNLNSSIFSKTLDVFNCSEDNMQIFDDVQVDNYQISITEKSDAKTASKNASTSNKTQIEPQTNVDKDSEESIIVKKLSDKDYSAHDDGDDSVEVLKKPRRRKRSVKSSGKRIDNDKFCANKSKTLPSSKNNRNPNSQGNDSLTLAVHNKESLCINSSVEKMKNNKNKSFANNFEPNSTSELGSNRKTGEKEKDIFEICNSQISPETLIQSNESIANNEKHVTEMAGSFVESSPNADRIFTENIKITTDSNAKNILDTDVFQNKDVTTDKGNNCSIIIESHLPEISALNSENSIMTPGKSNFTNLLPLSIQLFGDDSLDDESPAKMKNHCSPHPSRDLNLPNPRKLNNSTNMATGNSEDLRSRKTDRCNITCNSPSLVKSNKFISTVNLSKNHDTKDSAARNNNKRAFSPSSVNKSSSPPKYNEKMCNLIQEKGVISPRICSKTVSLNSPVTKRNSDSTSIAEPEPVSNMSTNSTFNINSNSKKSAFIRKATERKSLENIISFCKDKENAKRQQNSESIISINEENASKGKSDLVNESPDTEVSVGDNVSNIFPKNTSHISLHKGDIVAKGKDLSKESTCPLNELLSNATNIVTNLAVSEKQVIPSASTHNESNCSSKIYTGNVIDRNLHNKDNSPNSSSSVTNNKVAPPRKKRIRPIPVDSSSNESFSPFTHFLPKQNTSKATVSSCLEKKDLHKKCNSSIQNNPTTDCPNTTAEPLLSKIRSECSNILDYESLNSNLLSPFSSLLSPLKQFQAVPEFKSPASKKFSKCASPSPSTKSVSRSSYFASGKPKAMADFYKNAFPNKGSELPISPMSFSSSSFSCTSDAFRVKRNLQEANTNLFDKNEVDSIHALENICDMTKDLHEESNIPEFSHNPIINENQEFHSLEKISSNVDPKENNTLVQNVERMRKISESCYSDACSTIIDLSDSEIITPIKGDDWLNKDIFSITPFEKRKKFSDIYTDSDVTTDSSPEKVEDSRNEFVFSNISFNGSPIKVVNDPNHSCNVNANSVDSEKVTKDNVPFDKINVNKSRNLNTSSMNPNIGATPMKEDDRFNKDVFCKTPLLEKRKKFNDRYTNLDKSLDSPLEIVEDSRNEFEFSNISFNGSPIKIVNDPNHSCNVNANSVDPELSSKQAFPGRANKSYSNSDELGHNVKKRKNTTEKRGRQSRPTLKIASFKSPFKNQVNNRNSDSKIPYVNKTLKKKINPQKLENRRGKNNLKNFTDDDCMEVKVTGNKLITNYYSKLDNSQTEVAKLISENKIRKSPNKVAKKPSASLESTKPIGNIDQCESTRDIVESDIGRSNEEGSELSIAIASVERELQISQPVHSLCSPRLEASNTSQLQVEEKVDADHAQTDQKTGNIKNTQMSRDTIFEFLMSKIMLHGYDNVMQKVVEEANKK